MCSRLVLCQHELNNGMKELTLPQALVNICTQSTLLQELNRGSTGHGHQTLWEFGIHEGNDNLTKDTSSRCQGGVGSSPECRLDSRSVEARLPFILQKPAYFLTLPRTTVKWRIERLNLQRD